MKTIFYAIFCFTFLFSAHAQQWQWAYDEGATGGTDIESDGSGNVYVLAGVGYPVYGGYTLGCNPTGCAIAKHDAFGNIIWARGLAASAAAISLDKAGNIYITGSCGSGTFCGGNNPDISVITQGTDLFLCKYNNSGDIQWVKTWGTSPAGEMGTALKTDFNGNAYVAGIGSVYNPNIGDLQFNFIVLKYDAQGNLLWQKTSNWKGNMFPTSMDVDKNGNAYITGQFNSDSAYFGNISFASNGSMRIFIAKYNSSGDVVWAKKDGTNYDECQGICLDNKGNFYITGRCGGPSTFGGNALSSGGMLIAKYDTNGVNAWAKRGGGDMGYSVDVDTAGGSIITGYYSGTKTFGSGLNAATLTSPKTRDIFLAKFDKNGILTWVVAPSGSAGDESMGFATAYDMANNCYVTGRFCKTTIFGNTTLTAGQGPNNYKTFLVKLKDSLTILTDVSEKQISQGGIVVFPNPAGNSINLAYTHMDPTDRLELSIYNTNGQIMHRKNYVDQGTRFVCEIDVENYARGVYLIEITSNRNRSIKTIVLN